MKIPEMSARATHLGHPAFGAASSVGGWRHILVWILGGWCLVASWDCAGDTTGPSPIAATQPFVVFTLNQHAINIALTPPYDTMRLSTTTRVVTGAPVTSAMSPVTYQAGDTSVTVDSTGLLTARYVAAQTAVIATQTIRGVTVADTAYVQVTATAPAAAVDTFSIQPRLGGLDSAKIALYDDEGYQSNVYLPETVTLANGGRLCTPSHACPLLVRLTSATPWIVKVDQSTDSLIVTCQFIGRVLLSMSTYAYGVAKQDSLAFVCGYPLRQPISIGFFAANGRIDSTSVTTSFKTIGVGGIGLVSVGLNAPFSFLLQLTVPAVRVVFDDTMAVKPWQVQTLAFPNDAVFSIDTTRYSNGSFDVVLRANADSAAKYLMYGPITFIRAGTFSFQVLPGGERGAVTVSGGP